MADQDLRLQAAEAIAEGLRLSGDYKIVFVVTEQMGRVLQQDATTIRLVLDAAPEIKMNYGIIVNMVSKGVWKKLKKASMSYFDFLNSLFAGIKEEHRCVYSNVLFVSV